MFRQILPDLAAYRADFAAAGVAFPLPETPWRPDGLLAALPEAAPERRGWPWRIETSPPPPTTALKWPLITVVTPSYQQGRYLEETIRSVLLQNYPRLEFIILDGGSTDDSRAVLEKYRPWLGFARLAPDRGQGHAINLGFSLGSGDLVGWINSDDYLLPGTLLRVAEAWRLGTEFIYGDMLEWHEATGEMLYAPANLVASRYARFAGLLAQPGTFWSATKNRPLWEDQHCALDYELWLRLLPGLRLRNLRRPLAVARVHAAAKSYDPKGKARWDADARRNALAHPQLYRATIASRWLKQEFVIVQRLWRLWRERGCATRLEALRRECGWPSAPRLS